MRCAPLKDPPALRNLAQDVAKLAKQSRTTLLAPASVHREKGSLPFALPQRRDYVAVVLADVAKLAVQVDMYTHRSVACGSILPSSAGTV